MQACDLVQEKLFQSTYYEPRDSLTASSYMSIGCHLLSLPRFCSYPYERNTLGDDDDDGCKEGKRGKN